MMGQDVLNEASFIGTVGNNVMIRFPRKKVYFCFNHPRDPDTSSRSQKVGSLKHFEVCGVPKKEPWYNGQKAINPFGTIICLK
jgi:hypothetical protein